MIKHKLIGDYFIKTYSDKGNYILQNDTGEKYEEAIDIPPLRFSYSELDEPIPTGWFMHPEYRQNPKEVI